MIAKLARAGACALVPLLAPALGAGAQTPKPSSPPTPAPTPVAFSAHAHANVNLAMQGGTMSGTAQFAVAQRASLTRIDVLSVRSDTFPIPPISVTVVLDRGANTITAWSDVTKLYHTQPFLPRSLPSAAPRPSASPRPRGGASPFSKLDVFDVSLKLTGHTTTAGVPTTGMAFDMQVRSKGSTAASHITATTQLADDFAAFPMTIDLSMEPGSTPYGAKVSYAVDDFTAGVPPATRFEVPAGYAEAPSLVGVIFPRRPNPTPTPSAAPGKPALR